MRHAACVVRVTGLLDARWLQVNRTAVQAFYAAYVPTLVWLSEYNCSFARIQRVGSALLSGAPATGPVKLTDVRAAHEGAD